MGGLSVDARARWALATLAEPGDRRLGGAVAAEGAEAVLAGIVAGTSGLPGEPHYRVRLPAVEPDAMGAVLDAAGARYVVPGDSEWPSQLDDLGPARPLGLFVRGRPLREAAARSVAVVGARAATDYGQHVAAELSCDLAAAGWAVVSGGAYGVDAAAHRGALAAVGHTIAVLACGVDVAYPKGNAALLERVAGEGSVVSELAPGTSPTRLRFLSRNRVIAALTRGTVVVEAAARSGALSTAAAASALDRFVMVVPGPVTSAMSVGTHRLLQDDPQVRLVTRAADVVEQVGRIGELAAPPVPEVRLRDGLDPVAARVLEALPLREAATVEEVVVAAGLAAGEVGGALHRLLAAGLADRVPGGWLVSSLARPG